MSRRELNILCPYVTHEYNKIFYSHTSSLSVHSSFHCDQTSTWIMVLSHMCPLVPDAVDPKESFYNYPTIDSLQKHFSYSFVHDAPTLSVCVAW